MVHQRIATTDTTLELRALIAELSRTPKEQRADVKRRLAQCRKRIAESRGVPVDTAGSPLGGNALYITDGSGVYATTITATPLVRQWWAGSAAAAWVTR